MRGLDGDDWWRQSDQFICSSQWLKSTMNCAMQRRIASRSPTISPPALKLARNYFSSSANLAFRSSRWTFSMVFNSVLTYPTSSTASRKPSQSIAQASTWNPKRSAARTSKCRRSGRSAVAGGNWAWSRQRTDWLTPPFRSGLESDRA